MTMIKKSRGMRNNNPLNIRKSPDTFIGELAYPTDRDFKQFTSLELGIRAAIRILHTYNKRGITKIKDIVSRWAPSNENDTEKYIRIVCNITCLTPDDEILVKSSHNRTILLVQAMAQVESNVHLSILEISRAWYMAFSFI